MRIVKRAFHEVRFNAINISPDRSVLLLANHFSWWDGFLMYYINQILLKKRFHVMVIEQTVQKIGFFKYMGAFSVSKGSRDIIDSLNYAADLLKDPDNLVLIFPQGKLFSNFIDEVKFEKGLKRITEQSKNDYQLIMAATFIENFKHKKPTASVYLKAVEEKMNDLPAIKQGYQQHYNSSKLRQTEIVI
ncbi:lysophospholipid acyltransferase family protein [Mucilaginibacter litoreus]|uniref:Lysophospholipid acyltransferase family protein n=1 Tax=Mucilaginibacter litoreus TaxID=1048221 RepID=A0ABW3ATT8_9SPHI